MKLNIFSFQKKEELQHIKLQELDEVSELQAEASALTSKTKSPKKVNKDENSSTGMLMKLRQIANHPLLVR